MGARFAHLRRHRSHCLDHRMPLLRASRIAHRKNTVFASFDALTTFTHAGPDHIFVGDTVTIVVLSITRLCNGGGASQGANSPLIQRETLHTTGVLTYLYDTFVDVQITSLSMLSQRSARAEAPGILHIAILAYFSPLSA